MGIEKYLRWPCFSEEEVECVANVVRSNKVNYWTGSEGKSFEREFAQLFGVNHAVAVANGTVALDAIFLALNLGRGDEVIVTSRTFLASVSSIVNCGAKAVFADVDESSQNITAESIASKITEHTKAIVCVHLAGWPCDMSAIMDLASSHDLYVIEDCAQAHGAMIDGKHVGSFGHAAAWSFCQDKIITTIGEGGMVTTNDSDLFNKVWSLKDHGKTLEAVNRLDHPPGFRWLHESFGTNWRMTEAQAAVGRIQLTRLDEWSAIRTRNRKILEHYLRDIPVLRNVEVPGAVKHAWYRSYEFVIPGALKSNWSRDRIVSETNDAGVPLYQGSCSEVYLEKAFDGSPSKPIERLPVARRLGDTSLMWLVHPTLSEEDMQEYAEKSAAVLNSSCR